MRWSTVSTFVKEARSTNRNNAQTKRLSSHRDETLCLARDSLVHSLMPFFFTSVSSSTQAHANLIISSSQASRSPILNAGIPFAPQTDDKRFHWILRAGLSVLVADRAIAAIFAGHTTSYQ